MMYRQEQKQQYSFPPMLQQQTPQNNIELEQLRTEVAQWRAWYATLDPSVQTQKQGKKAGKKTKKSGETTSDFERGFFTVLFILGVICMLYIIGVVKEPPKNGVEREETKVLRKRN